MDFVANFMRFPAVQKIRKSVKIWQSYRESKGGNFFFETQCILYVHVNCALHAADSLTHRGRPWDRISEDNVERFVVLRQRVSLIVVDQLHNRRERQRLHKTKLAVLVKYLYQLVTVVLSVRKYKRATESHGNTFCKHPHNFIHVPIPPPPSLSLSPPPFPPYHHRHQASPNLCSCIFGTTTIVVCYRVELFIPTFFSDCGKKWV